MAQKYSVDQAAESQCRSTSPSSRGIGGGGHHHPGVRQARCGRRDTLSALRTLTEAESTYLDVFPDSLIGSFAVPDKRDLMGETLKFAFYLNKTNLIFIDEGQICTRLLDDIERIGVLKEPTAAHCLFEFMKLLVKDDLTYLADVEDRMEDVEEQIIDRCGNVANRKMLAFGGGFCASTPSTSSSWT